MRIDHKVLLSVLALLLCPLGSFPAWAQESGHRIEITPLVGSIFGGSVNVDTINVNNIDKVFVGASLSYGAIVDVSLNEWAQVDILWSRQPTDLSGRVFPTANRFPLTSATLDQYQFGLLLQGGESEALLRPFFVVGLGFTHFNPGGNFGTETKPAFNVGGGIKLFPHKNFGVRLETRWAPHLR